MEASQIAISRRLVELAMMYPPLKHYEAVKMNVEINLSHGVISGYTTNENARWEKNICMVCYHLSKWKGKAFQHTDMHTYTHKLIIFLIEGETIIFSMVTLGNGTKWRRLN